MLCVRARWSLLHEPRSLLMSLSAAAGREGNSRAMSATAAMSSLENIAAKSDFSCVLFVGRQMTCLFVIWFGPYEFE